MAALIARQQTLLGGCRSCHRAKLQQTRYAPRSRGRQQVAVKALFGGGGGLDMGKLMENVKKAQQMVQEQSLKVKEELDNTEFDGYDEEETVKVVVSGNQEPRAVEITQVAFDQGPEELSKRVTAAMRDAHTKSVTGMRTRMRELAQNLGLPGMGGMGGIGGTGP